MAKNISSIPLSSFFELNTDSRTRGHSLKLVIKHRCHLEMRRHFFSENKLNQDTASVSTVNRFKSRLEKEKYRRWACLWTNRLLGLEAVFNL